MPCPLGPPGQNGRAFPLLVYLVLTATLVHMETGNKNQDEVAVSPACRAAQAYGVDLSLLRENLRLTPQERIRAHGRALNEALRLRRAMREQHGRS